MQSIPFFGIDKFYQQRSEEILDTISSVFSHGKVLMGPEIEELEENLARYCGRKYAVAVGSCTDGLFYALKAAGISPGDEVLITSFSFIASVTPILRLGAKPVFVDIEPEYYMMDLQDLEDKITPRTRAIVAVHLFGQMLPFAQMEEIAQQRNLLLIEDAAQSLGALNDGRLAGSMGLCSTISFDPTKVIGAFGNGGIVLTDEEALASDIRKLRYHGRNMDTGEYEFLGYNSRLATSQAALINLQQGWVNEWIDRRNVIAGIFNAAVDSIDGMHKPSIRNGNTHIYHKYVLRTPNRDQLRAYMKEQGVQTMIHYPRALFEHMLFNKYDYRAERLDAVQRVKETVLSLPIYPELSDEEVDFIAQRLCQFSP
jgi:dTDP-4-amino-4,6-dideoxygalactose transaminase